jgi:alkylation response protein AidB-like acyl-CoA dehydrogenase
VLTLSLKAGSGSDAFALGLKAEDKGDKYVLNGHISFGSPTVKKLRVFLGVSPILIPRPVTKALPVLWLKKTSLVSLSVKKKTNWAFAPARLANLLFENCEVPKDNVIGESGQGL